MGFSDELSDSISTCHEFRNDLYHVGLQHEYILRVLARFHFWCACEFMKSYPVDWRGFTLDDPIPSRAQKYLPDNLMSFRTEQFREACTLMSDRVQHNSKEFIDTLAVHMGMMVEGLDETLDYLTSEAPIEATRDETIRMCQAWPLKFTSTAAAFVEKHKKSFANGFEMQRWLEDHYPFPFRKDPIPGWRQRVASLRKETNPHSALKNERTTPQ